MLFDSIYRNQFGNTPAPGFRLFGQPGNGLPSVPYQPLPPGTNGIGVPGSAAGSANPPPGATAVPPAGGGKPPPLMHDSVGANPATGVGGTLTGAGGALPGVPAATPAAPAAPGGGGLMQSILQAFANGGGSAGAGGGFDLGKLLSMFGAGA